MHWSLLQEKKSGPVYPTHPLADKGQCHLSSMECFQAWNAARPKHAQCANDPDVEVRNAKKLMSKSGRILQVYFICILNGLITA